MQPFVLTQFRPSIALRTVVQATPGGRKRLVIRKMEPPFLIAVCHYIPVWQSKGQGISATTRHLRDKTSDVKAILQPTYQPNNQPRKHTRFAMHTLKPNIITHFCFVWSMAISVRHRVDDIHYVAATYSVGA